MSTLLTAVLMFVGSPAFAGGASTGCCTSVMSADGQIRLLDLVPSSDFISLKSNNEFEKYFPTYQNKLGEAAINFFECSKKILRPYEKEFSILGLSSNIDVTLKPILVRFRLVKAQRNTESNLTTTIPAIAVASALVDDSFQELLAAYVKGRLWIVAPIYDKMDAKNKMRLASARDVKARLSRDKILFLCISQMNRTKTNKPNM